MKLNLLNYLILEFQKEKQKTKKLENDIEKLREKIEILEKECEISNENLKTCDEYVSYLKTKYGHSEYDEYF